MNIVLKYLAFSLCFLVWMISAPTILAQPGTTTEAEVNKQKVFIEANKQKLLENYEEATVLFKEVLKTDPRNHAAAYELARVYDVLDNDDKALSSIKVAVSLSPSNMWYKLFLADVLEKSMKYDDAAKIYQEMVDNFPDTEYHYFQLAFYQVKDNKLNDAIDTYNLIEKKFGKNVETTRKKHTLYLGTGDNKNAAKELESLVKAYPDNISYLHLLAGFYNQQGREADAKDSYKKILELDPNNAKAAIAIAADKKAVGGDDVSFLRSLESVFTDKNEEIDIKIKTLFPYIDKINEGQGNPELIEATLSLGKVLTVVHPEEAKAFSIYGDLLYHNNQPQEALKQYEETIKLNGKVFSVWEQIMYIHVDLYQMEELAKISEKAMDIFPNQVKLYYLNGIANAELQNHQGAISSLNQAMIMSGKNQDLKVDILSRMVKPLIATNKVDKAKNQIKKAIELDPENFRTINAQALLAIHTNESKKAEALYQKAMSKGGINNPEVLEDYADFLLQQGDAAAAYEYWNKAIKAGGKSDRLKDKISKKGL